MNRKYRKTIIAGNFKMNMLPGEIRAYAESMKTLVPRARWCETVICAPFVDLTAGLKYLKEAHISVGAQNMSEHPGGAYTGEVSGAMLRDLGVKYVIIGHSERRQYFGETDLSVNEKVRAALELGLHPIICVGESAKQRELGLTESLINYQVRAALAEVSGEQARKAVIAYEPIWAIGTGNTATAEQANEVNRLIRSIIRSVYGARAARATSILYGGSMNEKNAYELLAQPDIDGGLIGGASLVPEKFAAIVNASNQE